MFERFTDRARRVMVLAQNEARMLNHNHIGTEHILLGLIQEGEGVAALALDAMRVSPDDFRRDVERVVGKGEGAAAGHIPFMPPAKKVLELSLREALQLGHSYIGTEHILLGLVAEGEGVAAHVLQKRGADLARVRQTVIQLLSGDTGKEPESTRSGRSVEAVEGEVERFERGMRKIAEELLPSGRGVGLTPHESGVPICPSCRRSLIENARLKRVELDVEGEPSVVNIAYCNACGMALGIKVV